MRYLKVGAIPAKADPDEQEEYRTDKLEPRLEEAKRGERAVFFVDAAHFVMAAFLGMIWCFQRLFVKSPSGRKRFNVLGALNAITHEVILVTNDSYITASQVCELLRTIANLGITIPITLVLDNARSQKCRVVQDLAKSLKIELLYLPTYSPNLNLIERLWKFADEIAPRFPRHWAGDPPSSAFHQAVKKKCLYGKYYEDFLTFSSAISGCLNDAHLHHAKELNSLLTLRFQCFEKAQIMTV
jgi:transposase